MPSLGSKPTEDEIEVLVTGFGPFGKVKENPSFLCTNELHDTVLSTINQEAAVGTSSSSSLPNARRIHIQVLQTATAYSNVLDLVPRIHGGEPSAPEAEVFLDPAGEQPDRKTNVGAQGNGSPFPHGYRVTALPRKGYFDYIVHVGVGLPSNVYIETKAHKRGFQLADVRGKKAPIATDQSATVRRDYVSTVAEQNERKNMQISENGDFHKDDPIRGFGIGYESFADELVTKNDVPALVKWLAEKRGHKHVRQSLDAGRFLCDYIFYCSMAEAQRANDRTRVQFVHVPPVGSPYSLNELTSIMKDVISWIASSSS